MTGPKPEPEPFDPAWWPDDASYINLIWKSNLYPEHDPCEQGCISIRPDCLYFFVGDNYYNGVVSREVAIAFAKKVLEAYETTEQPPAVDTVCPTCGLPGQHERHYSLLANGQ